jgi:hypothetical protein
MSASCGDLVAALEASGTRLATHRGRVRLIDPDAAPVAYNADGSAVCRHRDLSVCPGCQAGDERYVAVHGATWHVVDDAERAELLALLAEVV